jgi:hypothetical protein
MKLPTAMTTVTSFTKYLALSLFVILPILMFFLGYMLPKPQPKFVPAVKRTNNNINPTRSPSAKSVKTLLNFAPFTSKKFQKRPFDTSKPFFFHFKIPQSVLSVPDDQLVAMRCTRYVDSQYHKFSFYDKQKGEIIPIDKNTVDTFYSPLQHLITISSGVEPEKLGLCETETGTSYAFYATFKQAYIAKLSDNEIYNFVSFPAMFSSCGNPIQLTKKSDLTFICEGGDTGSYAGIYKVNLENPLSNNTIIECYTGSPGIDPDPPKCE